MTNDKWSVVLRPKGSVSFIVIRCAVICVVLRTPRHWGMGKIKILPYLEDISAYAVDNLHLVVGLLGR